MSDVHGYCDPRFENMRDILAANLRSGADLGASVAVTLNNESVVDLWGGWADTAQTTPWSEHTITNVWSTTKTLTSLAALVLADRGELDVHAPVAKYWPEFAANGKSSVKVRHLMSHTSGVSAWAQPVTIEDLYDWEKSTAMLAAQPPWWEPGTASGYHAFNQGHLVGEVIRRITGKKLGEFFADEVAGPLGADFHIGLAPEHDQRVSNIVPPPPLPFDLAAMGPESVAFKTFTGPAPDPQMAWTTAWRRADVGAANGHGNARSVARLQSIIANGGQFDGVRLLSPKTIDLIFEEQSNGIDLAIGIPLRFGIGYALPDPQTVPYLPNGRVCYWGGWGGSFVVADLDRRLTIAYMMNKMAGGIIGGPRSDALVKAAYLAIG
ncbi:MAG: class A beta-lactamase-related serine hydrolase [Gammaproteobacteria bacterium]|nr:class A beta-lactamase-related serine hydrolase [Gammaproteobacteria bacterium]